MIRWLAMSLLVTTKVDYAIVFFCMLAIYTYEFMNAFQCDGTVHTNESRSPVKFWSVDGR
jgi:hypothetical protein